MKKKHLIRFSSLVLCLLVLLTGCTMPFDLPFDLPWANNGGSGSNASDNMRAIPYSQMEYTRPDADAMKVRIEELTGLITGAKNFKEMLKYDNEAGELMEEFSTMRTIAMLKNYHDSTDTFYEEEYRYCEDMGVELGNVLNKLNAAIVEGSFAEDYRKEVGDYIFESIKNDLLLDSDAVKDFKKERNQLNIDYNNHLSEMTLTYEGETYTMDDIMALRTADTFDTFLKLYMLYYKENATAFTEYYSKMVELDKKTAYELGFNSVADMYYLSFSRDYTPEDSKVFIQNSKEIFVPIAAQIEAETFDVTPLNFKNTMEEMPAALETISPELKQAWQHMIDNELIDYAPSKNKQKGIAFTTYLSAYDAPFIYGTWESDFASTTTIIHEFGHYYDNWLRRGQSSVFNLDIAETYSQGLEVLMHENFAPLIKGSNDEEDARLQNLQDFMNPLTYQVMLEDFQQRVYALDTFDAEVIARLYADIFKEYGMEDYSLVDENGCDYTWFQITHLFDAPFYTISYATSALVALQIWSAAQDDWQAGVDIYLELIHADQNQPFVQLIEGAGLSNPSDRDTMQKIADDLAETFDVTPQSPGVAA